KSYKNKKIEAAKRRRQAENKLKSILSIKRRSSSGLASLERRKEDTNRKKDEISQLLNQHLAQRDSIQRLKISAEERLRQEHEARDQVQQQSEFGEPAERASAIERLKIIADKIAELESELKQRSLTEDRLVKIIADLEKQKGKTYVDLKKHIRSKPSLLEQLKSSLKKETHLRPQVQSLIKREEQTNRDLSKIMQKVRLVQAARRKAQRKAEAKRRAIAQKKAAAKRKAAARRAAAKRIAAARRRSKTRTRKVAKRKISKRKMPKRKALKRKIKRKASKKSKRSRR
ncbi:MAG TPA: hypothetical protein VK431_02130, partial [Nitrosopumilaceae archaeon]|nr:hypothetical protein [Nitrosopumilaceae archaeon]